MFIDIRKAEIHDFLSVGYRNTSVAVYIRIQTFDGIQIENCNAVILNFLTIRNGYPLVAVDIPKPSSFKCDLQFDSVRWVAAGTVTLP